jgi:menaquinone-dependent protoporphyrinogen IX oxidase
MKSIVLYSSKIGNTERSADSMAAQLDTQAVKITPDTMQSAVDLAAYDLIFVGTNLYTGTPNEDM